MFPLKKKFLLFFIIPLLVITGYFYNNKALNFRFVDEEDNFVTGKYLSKGEILYDDIITNHQPLTYVFSALIHKYTNPNSVYVLLVRHRQFEIIWSIAWSVILIFYFGLAAFFAVLIYEFTKVYLLGNLFLSEAQIVYPLMLIAGLAVFNKRRLKALEFIFIGVCFGIALFLLSPVWPALVFLLILLLYSQRHKFRYALGFILVGIILPVLIIFKFSSLSGYLHYTFFVNLIYTIPSYHNESWVITASKAFLTPVLALFSQNNGPTGIVIKLFSVLLIANAVFLLIKKRYIQTIIIFILLGLSNIRFITPGSQEYEGFHLLPWYALFIFLISIFSFKTLKEDNLILRVFNPLVIIILLGLSISFAQKDLFPKGDFSHKDVMKDYDKNYSTAINRGDAVKVMKEKGDTLFVSPNAWIVYWQADIDHLPKLYGYYSWMSGIPKVHTAVLNTFSKNPPAYFYCENCKGLDLEKFLEKYVEIKNHGNTSFLYVLKSKIPNLKRDQLEQLKYYGFTL